MKKYDVLIVGGGAAGLMCALRAGARGKKVILLEHNNQLGKKILISGGGRCNFTNLKVNPSHFVSAQPSFSSFALNKFKNTDFIRLIKKHKLNFFEKKWGQLFSKNSSKDILNLLLKECRQSNVVFSLESKITKIIKEDSGLFKVAYNEEKEIFASNLVVATGGLSLPKLGASDFGYRLAKQFGLKVKKRYPALDGFRLKEEDLFYGGSLSGLSLKVKMMCENQVSFLEDLLFTHKGLSGPVALQASLQWNPNESLYIDFFPDSNLNKLFQKERLRKNKSRLLKNILAEKTPRRLADSLSEAFKCSQIPLGQWSSDDIDFVAQKLHGWELKPAGTVGYNKAEVTKGGVDTKEINPQSMEAFKVSGLYFVGEVLDVTGWLGGYNFQWAWSSGYCAGDSV